ncbi:hypothetical protein, partial [Salmonella sp. 2019-SM259]|uniref:hypothetical protein n=1 Tax=Salmonella sp. 2019-SM259 TaxID=3068194 RepID=UPI00376F5CE9
STGAVTAGIAAGSGAVGYGGYFAGFSSVPVITKVGSCPNVLLEVDNSYDSYQWLLNGSPIPNETKYQVNPELYGAGVYTCEISKNNCGFKTTQPYTYIACPQTFVVNDTIGNCKSKSYTLAFTK